MSVKLSRWFVGLAVACLLLIPLGCQPSDSPTADPQSAAPAPQTPAPGSPAEPAETENSAESRITESKDEADSTSTDEEPTMTSSDQSEGGFPVQKTEEEWQALLTPEQFRITRQKGTERAFTGKYWNTKTAGTYECVCCGQALFVSDAKFDSGCGWPSFFQAVNEDSIVTQPDHSIPPPRTEIMCSKCGAHLGHVFKDGPPPTGLRFCVNSASVKLIPVGESTKDETEE